ncbi:MAG: proton-conducting membrane transporter, partial [Rubrobacteraceae bacterium]
EYADIKTKEPESVTSLIGKVEGVSIPLGGRLLKPATALISEGDTVVFGQKIGEPVDDGFSIGVWSGMHGEVTTIEEDIVQISGGGVPLEDAEAETEAEAAR